MPFETTFPQLDDGYVNAVNDVYPGGGNSAPGKAPGQLGKIFWFQANGPFNSAVGTVREGHLRYVKTHAVSTAAPARGLLAYWSDKPNSVVIPDDPANPVKPAGIYLSAPTKGQHTLVQCSGRVTVKFKGTTTKASPVAGDAVIAGGGSGLADVLADATNPTWGDMNQYIGDLLTDPGATDLAEVDLNGIWI